MYRLGIRNKKSKLLRSNSNSNSNSNNNRPYPKLLANTNTPRLSTHEVFFRVNRPIPRSHMYIYHFLFPVT